MPSPFDTIVAPITGPGPGAVAVVRVSGPEAWRLAGSVFPSLPGMPQARHAYYGAFESGDDGYLLLFEEGRSYTGEASAEMSIHGSRASVSLLLAALKQAGARPAEPGEFTQRAFMNGRIDLTQAEAVRDTIEADTSAQLRMANLLREGVLQKALRGLADDLVGILAAIEASVDFSEEIGEIDESDLAGRIGQVQEKLQELLKTADAGRILREGLRIAIVGPPNAGKSSLLNRLLGQDRAIVTEIPGTTRDYVEEKADFGGFPVVLIDTAGLRETQDPVEAIGVQRSRAIAANADVIWYVVDAREPSSETFERPTVKIANKTDLAPTPEGFLGVSCIRGDGLPDLIQQTQVFFDEPKGVAIQQRHRPELEEAWQELETARGVLIHGRPPDLAAVGLRSAIQALGRITGETADADMIARIFRDFCIGK